MQCNVEGREVDLPPTPNLQARFCPAKCQRWILWGVGQMASAVNSTLLSYLIYTFSWGKYGED